MWGLGKECEAMSEAAPAVYPNHLHPPRWWDPSHESSSSVPLAAQRAHVCACVPGEIYFFHMHTQVLLSLKMWPRILVEHFLPEAAPTWFAMFSFSVQKVTVMHSMQAGYLEKAQKYTDKALMQLEKLKSKFVGIRSLLISPLMTVTLNQLWPTRVCSKCWTAVPSCPRSKSSCWSISSCAGWSLDTRPQLYKRYSHCRSTDSVTPVYSVVCLSFLIVV